MKSHFESRRPMLSRTVLASRGRDAAGTDHAALRSRRPKHHLGDVINDLQQRRAVINSTENRGGMTVLEAEAPLSAMFGYSAAVRSLSQGRARLLDGTLKYGPAPPDVQQGFI